LGVRVLEFVRSVLKTEYKPGPGSFLEIDDQKLIEKLKLKERGRERGSSGQPPSSSEIFDDIEQEAVNLARSFATDAHSRTHDQISTYAQRLKSADISGAAAEMRTLARQSEGDFDAEVIAARGDLEKAALEVAARRRDVEHFRKENRLQREPHPTKDHIWLGALLFIMFGIEIVPNAMILADAEALGILGGVTQAMIYSFLNIGFGFLCGILAWTNVIHRSPFRKLLGLFFSVAIAAGLLGLNLALAHYRTGAQTMPSAEAVAFAWQQLWTDPLAISDLKSAGMVAMGVFFSFIAMIDGYVWRDPYPGYASITSHLHEAEDHFHDLVDQKLGHLKEVQERFVSQIKTQRSRLRDKRQEIPLVLEERKRLIARFEGHLKHLQEVGRSLLAAYRTANQAARKDQGPKRFQEGTWVLDGFDKIEVDDSIWHSPESEWELANQALEASVDRLQSAYEEALSWIRTQADRQQVKTEGPNVVATPNT
jgi:hypothetical protein